MVIETGDVLDMVDASGDNLLRVTADGKLLMSYTQLERIVKLTVQKELQSRSLMDEEKR